MSNVRNSVKLTAYIYMIADFLNDQEMMAIPMDYARIIYFAENDLPYEFIPIGYTHKHYRPLSKIYGKVLRLSKMGRTKTRFGEIDLWDTKMVQLHPRYPSSRIFVLGEPSKEKEARLMMAISEMGLEEDIAAIKPKLEKLVVEYKELST